MKAFITSLLVTSAHSHVFARAAQCNADSCARAVTGTRENTASRVGTDCSAFQTRTVCPTPLTTTITSGLVSTTSSSGASCAITNTATLPAYAQTACSSGSNPSSRFASACSCAGSTASTVTAAQQTVTVVVPAVKETSCDTGADQSICTSNFPVVRQYTIYDDAFFAGTALAATPNGFTTSDAQACVDLCSVTYNCATANYYPLKQQCQLIATYNGRVFYYESDNRVSFVAVGTNV